MGCKAEDIVEGVKDSSRKVVFDILTDLKNENIIVNKKPNRRNSSYFPNKENEFVNLKEEILEFRNNFKILLKHSQSSVKIKNSISIINSELGLPGTKRTKTRDIMLNDKKNYEDASRIYIERYEILNETSYEVQRLLKILGSTSTEPWGDSKEGLLFKIPDEKYFYFNKVGSHIKSNISKANNLLTAYESLIKDTVFTVYIIWSIFLFQMFVSFITLKSLTKLTSIVIDKEILLKLNKEILEEIIEINSELAIYLSNFRISNVSEFSESILNLSFDQKMMIPQIIRDYSLLGLEKEITSVIDSLKRIKTFEIHNDAELIKNMTKFCNSLHTI